MQLSFDGFGCTEIDHQQILISDRMRFAYFGSRLVYSSAGRRYSINVIESEVSRRGVWLEAWVAEFGHLTGGGSQQVGAALVAVPYTLVSATLAE